MIIAWRPVTSPHSTGEGCSVLTFLPGSSSATFADRWPPFKLTLQQPNFPLTLAVL